MNPDEALARKKRDFSEVSTHDERPAVSLSAGPALRAVFWTLTGGAVSKVATLATTLILLKALSPADFGSFVALSACAFLALVVSDLGVSALTVKELAGGKLDELDGMLRYGALRLQTLPLQAAIFGAGVYAATRERGVLRSVVWLFACTSVIGVVQGSQLTVLRGRLKFREAEFAVATGRCSTVFLSLLALPGLGLGFGIRLLAAVALVGESITLIVAAVLVSRELARRDRTKVVTCATNILTLRAALPFGAISIIANLYNRLDILLVAALTSPTQMGFYALASRVQDGLYLIPASIQIAGLPMVSQRWRDGSGRREVQRLARNLMLLSLAFSVPISILLFIWAPAIIPFAVGSDYSGATNPVRVILWFMPFSAVVTPLYSALAGTGHVKQVTPAFIAALVSTGMAHLGIDWWAGATGAAAATFIREPVLMLGCLYAAKRASLLPASPLASEGSRKLSEQEELFGDRAC